MRYNLIPGTSALIFDLDGTLADTMPFHMKAWQSACRDNGFEMESSYLQSLTGTPARQLAVAIVNHYGMTSTVSPESLFKHKVEIYYRLQSAVKEIKPVADIVREFYGKMPMAIGTGGFREAVYNTLDIIGMKDMFGVIVTSDDVEKHKPDPETFLKCAEKMNVDPSSITVFEDGDLGIEAAHRAGMNAVDVRDWYENKW